jgi:hypothetical protein
VTLQPQPDCREVVPSALLSLGDEMARVPLFRRAGPDCVREDAPAPGRLRRLGPPVAPDAFVAATESAGPAGRITTSALAGDDGSGQPCGGPQQDPFDRARGEGCVVYPTADGRQRCLPLSAARAPLGYGYHADAACQTPVLGSIPGCPDPSLVLWSDLPRPECPRERVTSVLPLFPYAGPTYSRNDIGDCTTVPLSPSAKLWSLGPKLADDGFAEATLIEVPATGRLRARMWEWEGGHRQWTGLFTDSARGETCRPGKAADGKLRCLPVLWDFASAGYRDAACTTPVRFIEVDPCVTEKSLVDMILDECPFTYRVYPLERAPGSAVHVKSASGCSPAPGTEVGLLGPEVPPSALVELTERAE